MFCKQNNARPTISKEQRFDIQTTLKIEDTLALCQCRYGVTRAKSGCGDILNGRRGENRAFRFYWAVIGVYTG